MLGRFLELSIATSDIRASLDFYARLGFSSAEVGEAWSHPYAVVTDGRLCLGLHEQSNPAPTLTFVKPDLFKHLGDLERAGATLCFRHLGNDVFNEVGFRDPSGHLIRLVEARTFSPSKREASERSLCGHFLQLALPTPQGDAAKDYWERLGFVGMQQLDDLLPHRSCTSDTLELGLYEMAHIRALTLMFEIEDAAATLVSLDAVGVTPSQLPAALRALPVTVLTAPEGTPLLLWHRP